MSKTDLLTTADAARELGVRVRWVRRMCQQGRLGELVGGRYVIRRAELQEFKCHPRRRGRPPTT